MEVISITIEKILKRINTILAYAAGVLIAVCALLMLYDTIVRYFFDAPSPYVPDLVAYLTLGAIFFGAGYSFQSGAQVYIEIIVDKLLPLPRKICCTIGNLLALTFVGVLLNESRKFAGKAFADGWQTYGNVKIPSGLLYAAMVFGCVFLFFSVVLGIYRIWKQTAEVEK